MKRIKILQSIIKKRGLGAVLITKPENVRYLCGFIGTNGRLLITPKKAILITDFRYLRSSKKQIPKEISVYDQKDGIKKVMGRFKSVGFEEDDLTYKYYLRLRAEVRNSMQLKNRTSKIENRIFKQVKLIPISGIVEGMRMIKSKFEVRIMKKGVKIANKVFEKFVKTIKTSQLEDEMEWNLTQIARKLGADGFSFPPIICFGKETADVHHIKASNRLKKGEKIMIDFGIKYKGYCTDMTRVIYTAKPTNVEYKIYSTILEANKSAIKSIKVGMKLSDVDKAARDVIEKAGFGQYFGHSTGHGVGLEVHELPQVSENSDMTVQPGMVFTIEPGIYSDKLGGGVRIEDMVYVNERGRVEVWTKSVSKEMRVIKV